MTKNKFFHKNLKGQYQLRINKLLSIIADKDKLILELKRNHWRKSKISKLEHDIKINGKIAKIN